jgi:hypothetical protein
MSAHWNGVTGNYIATVWSCAVSFGKLHAIFMPAKPVWFHRLRSILAELRALDTDYLDRRSVERIFGVRQRRARQFMVGLPTLQIGNTVAISRIALLKHLETVSVGSPFQGESDRGARLA